VGRRTKARECAFQILYQWQITAEPIAVVLDGFWRVRSGTPGTREMAERLARGTQARAVELDAAIAEAATHWRIDRIATVDRTILRLGAYELSEEKETPAAVVLDEAVELAKRFGEEDSPAFVNGVLDAIRKRVRGEVETEKR
jgi:N utilization substance protein B